MILLSFFSPHLVCAHHTNNVLCFLDTWRQRLSAISLSPCQRLPTTSHHTHPCQLASPSVFMPARRVSARLFQTFHPHHLPADWSVCRPKSPPAQRAQWSLFWAAKLSGLTAPIGPTSLPDTGECLDRQILAAMPCENPSVCVLSADARACKHTPSGPLRIYHCSEHPVS